MAFAGAQDFKALTNGSALSLCNSNADQQASGSVEEEVSVQSKGKIQAQADALKQKDKQRRTIIYKKWLPAYLMRLVGEPFPPGLNAKIHVRNAAASLDEVFRLSNDASPNSSTTKGNRAYFSALAVLESRVSLQSQTSLPGSAL